MGKYVVKSRHLTLAKRTELVQKDKTLWAGTPDAWKQGEYTCVVVKEGNEIDSDDYEDASVRQAFVNKLLVLAAEETDEPPVAKSNKGSKSKLLKEAKAKTEAKVTEADDEAKDDKKKK